MTKEEILKQKWEETFTTPYEESLLKDYEDVVVPAMDDYAGSIISQSSHITDTTTMPEKVFNFIYNAAIDEAIGVVLQAHRGSPLPKDISGMLSSPFSKIISKLQKLKK